MSDSQQDKVRSALNEQIEAFLSRGGEIQEVPIGTSGAANMPKKTQWSKGAAKAPEA